MEEKPIVQELVEICWKCLFLRFDKWRWKHSCKDILWATPSAASPRTLVLALGLQILGIIASGSWHPGGLCDNLGTLGSTTKDTFRSRLGFSLTFGGFRDPILRAF